MNCRATSICITDYIILFDNPMAAIFRNDPSCFAGSRMSLASCEPHSSETSNQLDVFVQNLAPGAAQRLGLDYETLSKKYPRLIVCDISDYGLNGLFRDKKA